MEKNAIFLHAENQVVTSIVLGVYFDYLITDIR